jgi:AAA+ superfamily predicted ATPase
MNSFDRPTNGHALAPPATGDFELSLAEDTRTFLRELIRELAQVIQPPESRWEEEQSAFVSAHLGVPAADQTRVVRNFPAWASKHVLVAVDRVLKQSPYTVREVVDFGYNGRCVPTYSTVGVSPDERQEVIVDGWYALNVGDVPLALQVQKLRSPEGMQLMLLVPTLHKDLGLDLLRAIVGYPNFFRGASITVDESSEPSFLTVPEVALDDVVFEPDVWAAIRQQVLDFVEMEQAFRAVRLPFRRGVILAGPPGVGKTLLFRALTHRLIGRCTVLWLTARAVPDAAAVTRVFELARSLAPTLMLWEDVDLTVRDRNAGNAAVLGELLAQLDGPASSDGVIACASTNDPSVLDEALSARPSRFDRIVAVGPPCEAGRARMLERFVADIPHVSADLAWVAREAVDMTGADLRELVIVAFSEAQRESADRSTPAELTTHHFGLALRQMAEASAVARRAGVRRARGSAARLRLGFVQSTPQSEDAVRNHVHHQHQHDADVQRRLGAAAAQRVVQIAQQDRSEQRPEDRVDAADQGVHQTVGRADQSQQVLVHERVLEHVQPAPERGDHAGVDRQGDAIPGHAVAHRRGALRVAADGDDRFPGL